MADGLQGQRGDVQPAQADVRPAAAVVVRDLVGAVSGGDVHLDHHQVGLVVQVQGLHVLVLEGHLVAFIQVARQGRQPEGWKERVLDRPPERAFRLGQRR